MICICQIELCNSKCKEVSLRRAEGICPLAPDGASGNLSKCTWGALVDIVLLRLPQSFWPLRDFQIFKSRLKRALQNLHVVCWYMTRISWSRWLECTLEKIRLQNFLVHQCKVQRGEQVAIATAKTAKDQKGSQIHWPWLLWNVKLKNAFSRVSSMSNFKIKWFVLGGEVLWLAWQTYW